MEKSKQKSKDLFETCESCEESQETRKICHTEDLEKDIDFEHWVCLCKYQLDGGTSSLELPPS